MQFISKKTSIFMISFLVVFYIITTILPGTVFIGPINKIDSEGLNNIQISSMISKSHKLFIIPTQYNPIDIRSYSLQLFLPRKTLWLRLLSTFVFNPKIVVFADQRLLFSKEEAALIKIIKLHYKAKKIAYVDVRSLDILPTAVHRLNSIFNQIIVEDELVRTKLDNLGVTIPIKVIPKIIDFSPLEGIPIKSAPNDIFIFNVFISSQNKYLSQIKDVIESFSKTFYKKEDVLLRIHVRKDKRSSLEKDISEYIKSLDATNIFLTEGVVSEKVFHQIFKYSDCLINLGNDQNLNRLKALYLGIPVINYANNDLELSQSNLEIYNQRLINLNMMMRNIYDRYSDFLINNKNTRVVLEKQFQVFLESEHRCDIIL